MSNIDNHIIGIFQDDLETVKEFLKIAINTIIFNRWLNNTNYICEKSIIKDISYMKIEDASVEKDVDNILNDISYYSKNHQKFQINLEFYTRNKGFFLGFFQKKESWEKWNILVIVSDKSSENKEKKMRTFISMIIKKLNTDKDFMPEVDLEEFGNIGNNEIQNDKNCTNFPYELSLNKEFEQNSIINIVKNSSFDKINYI